MDRFIHHYTRFRAHSDSLALEQNMHATNLHRIRSSLHSSAIGTIPWLQVDRYGDYFPQHFDRALQLHILILQKLVSNRLAGTMNPHRKICFVQAKHWTYL